MVSRKYQIILFDMHNKYIAHVGKIKLPGQSADDTNRIRLRFTVNNLHDILYFIYMYAKTSDTFLLMIVDDGPGSLL